MRSLLLVGLLAVAAPAVAEDEAPRPDPFSAAAGELLKQGVLGVLVVALGTALWWKDRQREQTAAQFVSHALKQTEVMAEWNQLLRQGREDTEKILEELRRRP